MSNKSPIDHIYTIGNVKNYKAALVEHGGPLIKLAGGYAFLTQADAIAEIERVEMLGHWGVWSLNANWPDDVRPLEASDWDAKNTPPPTGGHVLKYDRPIIDLVWEAPID